MLKITRVETPVVVVCPPLDEKMTPRKYAFRISASGAAKAEISIDDSPWKRCRFVAGYWWYWWYDWFGHQPGKHQAHVQIYDSDGGVLASASRQVIVR